jgi:hypothetical protein
VGKAYVWRAAIAAAVVNMLLNPAVAVIGDVRFVPVVAMMVYVDVATLAVALLVSTLGARRLHRELARGHGTPHGGTAWEKQLLEGTPASPWAFGLLLGLTLAFVATLVLITLGIFGFSGFAYVTFVSFVAAYSAAVAFVGTRWTIVRQLMEPVTVG